MASVHLGQNGDCFNDTDIDKILPPNHDDSGEIEGSLQIPSDTTVDKFQEEPEIQPRIGDQYQVELPPFVGGSSYVSNENFLVGLPILLTWISSSKRDILGLTSSDFKNVSKKEETSFGDFEPLHNSRKRIEESKNYLLVPGLLDVHWSAIEKDSFILGLYIFEKNFVEVRRFIGTKDMGALLSFYYGKFYGSQECRRWSACRKTKGKKGIYGQRIFSGMRQQELLSRIFPRVSEECRNALLEVSKTFADEKMSLTDYVSSLKAMIGVNILVEAVAIGTGKQDLTGTAFEPSKSNQVGPIRPEIPTGKACSSLTANQIVRFLSGNYRLSKARSNDLFWEAVWPRLLARGWHSEQPKNQAYIASSKHCLVFLLPGVKKFSRRKLVKGDHYFDSVADVLSKVAEEPKLIELENEEIDKNENEDDISNAKEDDVSKARQRHFYLQPRNHHKRDNTVVVKFTVVDTSLSNGRVRELRSLPSEISSSVFIGRDDRIEENYENTPEKKKDKVSRKVEKSDAVYPDFKSKNDLQGKKKMPKSLVGRKMKQRNEDYVGPTSKRCRVLVSCSKEETAAPKSENGISSCCSEILSSQVGPTNPDKHSSASSSKGSPDESNENPPQPQILIDLNLPHPDNEYNDPVRAEEEESLQNIPVAAEVARAENEMNTNQRRHSTRNQTPTMRTLQAVAHGYLTVSRRRKGKDAASSDDVRPRQRPRGGGGVGPNESTSSSAASQVEESSGNGASTSGNESHVPPPTENNEESGSRR